MKIWKLPFMLGALIFSQSVLAESAIIKILGINDFHGQITTGRVVKGEPVGGAAVLAAYLEEAEKSQEKNTLIALMGDQVGASVPASGLLKDQPSILFLNKLANP